VAKLAHKVVNSEIELLLAKASRNWRPQKPCSHDAKPVAGLIPLFATYRYDGNACFVSVDELAAAIP
jgi:hypothetical protein